MAPHSSTLAWEIPWTEEPGGLQSLASKRVSHYSGTKQQQKYFREKKLFSALCFHSTVETLSLIKYYVVSE